MRNGSRRGWLAVLTALLLLLCVSAQAALSYPFETTTTDKVNMRRSASAASVVLERLDKGAAIAVTGARGSYYKVRYDGRTGYVLKKYVNTDLTAPVQETVDGYPYETTAKNAVNIREAREQAGLSQKALGQLLELPQTRISQIERGKVDEATGRQILQRLSAIREAVPAVSEGTDALTASGSAQGPSVPQPVLGNKIRESRLGAGLSKKALGNLLGMSPGRVTRMESGTVDEATALQVLAAILEAQARQ